MLAKVDPKHLRSESVARVVVDVMLKPEILDPQGQAVANALPRLGAGEVASVRIGRRIELEFDDEPDPVKVHEIADRLLANPVIEDYSVTVDGAPVPRPAPDPVGPASGAPGSPDPSAADPFTPDPFAADPAAAAPSAADQFAADPSPAGSEPALTGQAPTDSGESP